MSWWNSALWYEMLWMLHWLLISLPQILLYFNHRLFTQAINVSGIEFVNFPFLFGCLCETSIIEALTASGKWTLLWGSSYKHKIKLIIKTKQNNSLPSSTRDGFYQCTKVYWDHILLTFFLISKHSCTHRHQYDTTNCACNAH